LITVSLPNCFTIYTDKHPAASRRGIKLATLQSSGVFDPRGIRQISMQAWLFSSLLRENKICPVTPTHERHYLSYMKYFVTVQTGSRIYCASRENMIQVCKIPSPKAIFNGFCM